MLSHRKALRRLCEELEEMKRARLAREAQIKALQKRTAKEPTSPEAKGKGEKDVDMVRSPSSPRSSPSSPVEKPPPPQKPKLAWAEDKNWVHPTIRFIRENREASNKILDRYRHLMAKPIVGTA